MKTFDEKWFEARTIDRSVKMYGRTASKCLERLAFEQGAKYGKEQWQKQTLKQIKKALTLQVTQIWTGSFEQWKERVALAKEALASLVSGDKK